jgi:hypothetical protein
MMQDPLTGKASLAEWADETIGDTHIDKQKQKTMIKNAKGKNKSDCLQAMMKLLVRKGAQNTKNSI